MFVEDNILITTRPVLWPCEGEFFETVGEQYRRDTVVRMQECIRSNASLVPPAVILIEDDGNPHDEHAVAVLFPFSPKTSLSGSAGYACEVVGYLPRDDAKRFRKSLQDLGVSGRPLEACGCVAVASDAEVGNVKIYLPRNFATLVKRGFADDPANKPAWLVDQTAVSVKAANSDYSDDECRRLYCRYAQMKSWNSLPYMIEEKVAAWQHGIGPVGLAIFYHRTGVDKYSEEGKRQLATIATQTAERQLAHVYSAFDDLAVADVTQALHAVCQAAGDAESQSPSAGEMVMLEQLKKLSDKKFRGLATGWRKLKDEATTRITDASSLQRFLAFAEQKTLFMFSVLLSDTIGDVLARATSKPKPRDQRLTIEKGIATTIKQAEAMELAGVAEELQRFQEYLQVQMDQLPRE
jgi:hypothetical protein